MFSKNVVKTSLYTFLFISLIGIILIAGLYLFKIRSINQEYHKRYNTKSEVALRKFPYPYRAAIAISSDIDNTETLEEFLEINKFINTDEMTTIGKGLGLQLGNSFFFYEPPSGAISYFQGVPEVTQAIINSIKAGHIDFMHSYGKKVDFTRDDAITALQELKGNDLKLDVWVDHTRSIDNFGNDRTFGFGDHPDSEQYHADLTLEYGIKFAWLGRVTMIIGQSVPITLETFTTIYDHDHPINSLINISKESAKSILAVYGSKKYEMHKDNDLLKITELDDGQKIYEFMRFNKFWEGVGTGATNKRLASVISADTLARLKETEGYMIVYTHLGENDDCSQYICNETQSALRNLATEYREGNIYLTTTSKLLNYYIDNKYLQWSYNNQEGKVIITIYKINDPVFGSFIPTAKNLEGITFYVPNANRAMIYLNNEQIKNIQINPNDHTERESITIS